MNSNFANWDDRTLELAIELFTVGLSDADRELLESLTREEDLLEFETCLASIHLASLGPLEAPPQQFLESLHETGCRQVLENADSDLRLPASKLAERGRVEHELDGCGDHDGLVEDSRPRTPGGLVTFGGWLVAAAALVLSIFLNKPAPESTVAVLRDQLIERAPDLVRIGWTATEDPAGAAVSGDVVWSTANQEGYMHFHKLEPNDSQNAQYQLWIFDPTRVDWESKPVDGGVFDVATNGDAIVPIDAKLHVKETALFAVTLEAPGGVVVSSRDRLVVTAAL